MIGDRVKHAIRDFLITNCESSKNESIMMLLKYVVLETSSVSPSDVVPFISDCSAMRSFGQQLMDQWETEYKLYCSKIRDLRSLNLREQNFGYSILNMVLITVKYEMNW